MNVEHIAKVLHQANKAYCETIGDDKQIDWIFVPQWKKDSIISGVQFKLDNPEASPEDLHDNWMQDLLSRGWRWGNTRDDNAKRHPSLVIYSQLPEVIKKKDELFIAIIDALK